MALNQGYSYRLVWARRRVGGEFLPLSRSFDHSTIEQWQSRLQRGEILIDSIPAQGNEQLRAGRFSSGTDLPGTRKMSRWPIE